MTIVDWSEDRQDWVAVGDLQIGERVKAKNKIVQLSCKEQIESQKVYNFEIYQEHTYLVSEKNVWVHNSYLDKIGKTPISKIVNDPKSFANQAHIDDSYIRTLAKSMKKDGYLPNRAPDKINIYSFSDGTSVVFSGHHRFIAAKLTGTPIPSNGINLTNLSRPRPPKFGRSWENVNWSGY